MPRVGVLGTGDEDIAATTVPEPIARVAGRCEPVLLPVPGAVFPSNPAARRQTADAYVASGLRAAASGEFAALLINTVGDYGIAELRANSPLPVAGSGEAACRFAMQLGRRFSIVTLWPPALGFIYEPVLAAADPAGACAGVHHLSTDADLGRLDDPDNPIVAIRSCAAVAIDSVRERCEQALREDKSDVIVLGCTCMAGLAAPLAGSGLRLVEPMRAGFLAAEALAAIVSA